MAEFDCYVHKQCLELNTIAAKQRDINRFTKVGIKQEMTRTGIKCWEQSTRKKYSSDKRRPEGSG